MILEALGVGMSTPVCELCQRPMESGSRKAWFMSQIAIPKATEIATIGWASHLDSRFSQGERFLAGP